MKSLYFGVALLAVSACATEPYPQKRPLTAEAIEQMGATNVVLVENNSGVEVSWFMQDSSATGAQYGLIGGLTSAIMDGIANAAPSARAERVANDISEEMISDSLNEAFVETLTQSETGATIAFADVSTRQPILNKDATDEAIEIITSYTLAEDGSALRATAVAKYSDAAMQYVTPYVFEKSVPKAELEGPLYRNTFVYNSATVPVPTLTEDMKAELVAALQESFKDADGNLPVEGDDDYKKMKRQLEDAQDDKLKKYEALVFVSRDWLDDDAALLKAEVEAAHAFFAKYILLDINSTEVPSLTGNDELVETLEDGRVIRKIGAGVSAGQYVSSPGATGVFSTYGNATRSSDAERDKVKRLKAAKKAS